jgi:hypothetical protein
MIEMKPNHNFSGLMTYPKTKQAQVLWVFLQG